MEKHTNQVRNELLEDLNDKSNTIIELITDISDKYSGYSEYNMILKSLRETSDQLHRISMIIASGETPADKKEKDDKKE